MPELGEIKLGREIGYKETGRHIWAACEGCDKERWVRLSKSGKLRRTLCQKCGIRKGVNSEHWKGGRYENYAGYIMVYLQPEDFFFPMARKTTRAGGYVLEHRLVVAKALGRCLHSWEIVHHKGVKYPKGSKENRQDNRYPENLKLIQEMQHNQITIMESKIDKLLEGQRELKQEIRLLRLENKSLREKRQIW